MSKPVKIPKTVTLELPPDDPDEEQSPAERAAQYAREAAGLSDDDAEDFFQVIDEIRGTQGVSFQVTRTEPQQRAGYCIDYPGVSFTLQRLTRDYGPGTYRVRVKGPGGKFIPGGGTIRVAEGVPTDERVPQTSSVQDMLSILKADKERSADNMLKWIGALSPLLAPVLANLFSGNKGQVAELLAGLRELQGLQPKPDKPVDMMTQLNQVSDIFGKLREMSGEEKSSTGATWIDLIRDAIQGAKPVIETLAMRALSGRPASGAVPMIGAPARLSASISTPAAAQPASAATAQSSTSAAPASASEAEPVGLMALIPWLRATAEQLSYQASRDKDPEFYAEVVLDNLPDGVKPQELLGFIERADWWTMLAAFCPVVSPYQGWFEKFRAAVIEALKENAPAQPSLTIPPGANEVPAGGGE